ncbi:DUF1684 domain-containing protein [Aquimarina rhabdastrellae]
MKHCLIVLLLSCVNLIAQKTTAIKEIRDFQEALNKKFVIAETTPLTSEDLEVFTTHEFFAINMHYRIKADFIRTPYETPFIMQTTTNREPIYVKYGEVHFRLNKKKYILNVYQNQALIEQEEYKNYLFLPFTDLTNGKTTYGGGRFIDLEIPEKQTIIIDFNKAYNPYCAYNNKYSCPIPPEENHLEIEIPVGVKSFKRHKL